MSQNPNNSGTPAPFQSKLLIAKALAKQNADAGISEEAIDAITTAQEADELIAYLKPKENAAPVADGKPKILKINAGKAPLPDPSDPLPRKNAMTIAEKMNPLHYKNGERNLWSKGARVLMRFNESTGDMEVF